MDVKIPRFVLAATQSGAGKTTLATGILAVFRAQGKRVQAYKVGPDYIDPGYHAWASGRPTHNLDTWLMPSAAIPAFFQRTSAGMDLALIEGVMGLYDGGRQGISSTAEIAKQLKAPVVLVIDARSMGASAAAIALGFRQYDPEVQLAGVILNRLGSSTHKEMIAEALERIHIPLLGALFRDEQLHLPERHLGLLPTLENPQKGLIGLLADRVREQIDLPELESLSRQAGILSIPSEPREDKKGDRCSACLAVARDEAFSFYYPESLRELERAGAELQFFSPLHDAHLPKADGIFLGGGFPEMFAEALEQNQSMRQEIRCQAKLGMPIYGECGGFMYLKEYLQDFSGNTYHMAGVIPGGVKMNERLQMVGYVCAQMQKDTLLGPAGTTLRGHEFHFSSECGTLPENTRAYQFTRLRNQKKSLAGYAENSILGSYLHIHFSGCPEAARNFVICCQAFRQQRGD